jgi:hypothetical protein
MRKICLPRAIDAIRVLRLVFGFPSGRSTHVVRFSARIANPCVKAALLPLLAISIAPSRARADCGHDVSSAASRARLASLSGLQQLEESGALRSQPAPLVPRGSSPCSGAGCREGRQLPDVPSPSSTVRNDSWCHVALAEQADNALCVGLIAIAPALQTRHYTSPLERPPRPPVARTLP